MLQATFCDGATLRRMAAFSEFGCDGGGGGRPRPVTSTLRPITRRQSLSPLPVHVNIAKTPSPGSPRLLLSQQLSSYSQFTQSDNVNPLIHSPRRKEKSTTPSVYSSLTRICPFHYRRLPSRRCYDEQRPRAEQGRRRFSAKNAGRGVRLSTASLKSNAAALSFRTSLGTSSRHIASDRSTVVDVTI
ncbi:hypothetical protein GY45DRAFT_1038073 [Cubamyces sp. BRFM 1775]|nr:hypothetical protein GY45DRAFT_1038073 [Cubamyces sp. BRFM 1775]